MKLSTSMEDQETRKIFTVSQINRRIKSLLDREFQAIWLEGEVSNFKHHSSGHMYFTLKDEKSQISAVFFSRQNQYLKFDLKDGLQVVIFGRVSSYEPRGQYQVYVERIEPKGVGSLELAFKQLKEKLSKAGLFDDEYKKEIPRFPQTVGVITSPTGAAIRDILNVIQRRFSGTSILLNPVRVQGEGAAQEIADAIDEMNQYGKMDVLIVGRGGGSLEDLWAFNEEIVAQAIFKSKLPIISAVGHEIDWTISDMVADLRAPTPSAAAELVVQNGAIIRDRLLELRQRVSQSLNARVESLRERLQSIEDSYAFRQPRMLLESYEQKLDDVMKHLFHQTKSRVQTSTHEFRELLGRLEALSPLKVLERGYSVTLSGDRQAVLRNAQKVKKGSKIVTRLSRGKIYSVVDRIEEE